METRPEFSQLAIPHWIASLPESGGVLEAAVFLANPEGCTLRARIPCQLTSSANLAFVVCGGKRNTAMVCPSNSPESTTRPWPNTDTRSILSRILVNRINFSDGRISPTRPWAYPQAQIRTNKDTRPLRLQANLENLNNRPNVLISPDFSSPPPSRPPEVIPPPGS